MTHFHFIMLLVTFFSISSAAQASIQDEAYYYNLDALPAGKKSAFLEVRESINNFNGGIEALEKIQVEIDSFINEEPLFLPIYIEQARNRIMLGYSGVHNPEAYNREALTIVQGVILKDAKYPKPYVLAGNIHTNLNEYKKSEKMLKEASRLGTVDPWLFLNWSTLKLNQGDAASALNYSIKGLKHSLGNTKALIYAISVIVDLSSRQNEEVEINIQEVVFEVFDDPVARLAIAGKLIGQYKGRRKMFQYAHEIISKQKIETPDLAEVDLRMAGLILSSNQISFKNHIHRYQFSAIESAEKLLLPIINDPSVKLGVIYQLFKIEMSRDNFNRANNYIKTGALAGMKPAGIAKMQATLAFAKGAYQEVVDTYTKMIELDPSWENDDLLSYAYKMLGSKSQLNDFHKRKLIRHPQNAWAKGNYASFLLSSYGDLEGAVKYGEQAIEIMPYPRVLATTALAYQALAVLKIEGGDRKEAFDLFNKSVLLGDNTAYISEYCQDYCERINKLRGEYRKKDTIIGRIKLYFNLEF